MAIGQDGRDGKSPSTSSTLASSARIRSSLAAAAKRDAATVTSSPRPRPDQARAWPRLRAVAHATAPAPWPASRLATTPRALKLRTGFAVSSLMLTVHPRPGSSASHRYRGVPRKPGRSPGEPPGSGPCPDASAARHSSVAPPAPVSTRSPSHPKTLLSRQTARMSYYYVNQAPLKRGDHRAEGVGFEPTRTHSLVLRPLKAAAIGH
jgi:hypothetical protein